MLWFPVIKSSLKAEEWSSGLWLAGGRRQAVCVEGFPSVRPTAVQCVKSAEQSSAAQQRDSLLPTVSVTAGITVFSQSEQTCALNEVWFFSVISSPWAAWMWCTKCSVLSLISAPTAPITTRYIWTTYSLSTVFFKSSYTTFLCTVDFISV